MTESLAGQDDFPCKKSSSPAIETNADGLCDYSRLSIFATLALLVGDICRRVGSPAVQKDRKVPECA